MLKLRAGRCGGRRPVLDDSRIIGLVVQEWRPLQSGISSSKGVRMAELTPIAKAADTAMIGMIDPKSPMPLYYQIYLRYKHLIKTGQIAEGDRLPAESALENAIGVSRITAKRAMDELANDGLVMRERGRGTTVIHKGAPSSVSADISGLVSTLVAIGESTTVELLAFDYVEAPASVAQEMMIDEGTRVQRVERLRLKDDSPFSYIITHIPEDIGRTFGRGDLANHPILSLVEAAGHTIHEADQVVSAKNAPPAIAEKLRVPENSALLHIRRIVRNSEGRPVQHLEVYYRSDMYRLNMNMVRVTPTDGSEIWAARNEAAPIE